MTTLTIEQGNNIEIVSSAVILKLYETALNSTNVTLSGNLQCDHCFENAYDYFTGYVTEGVKRFPDLAINVTDGKYVSFADPEVLKVFASEWGDGTGVTFAQMNSHTKIKRTDFVNTDPRFLYGGNAQKPFFCNTSLTSFNELGRFTNITLIDELTFYGTTNLTSIDLSNIQKLGMLAFRSSGITGVINLPNLVNFTDRNVFTGCSNITEINIGSNFTGLTGTSQFENCSSLTKITGLSGTTIIPTNSFLNCNSLSDIDIDFSSLTNIGTTAFQGCSSLVILDLSIPNLTSIGNKAFYQCTKLYKVSNLGLITSIPSECFSGCTNLTSITISNTITSIEGSAFKKTAIQNISIPNTITQLSNSVFLECSNLTSVTLPTSITSIGNLVFYKCTSLLSITIPSSCTTLGTCVFLDCSNLNSTLDLSNITSIGSECFNNCTNVVISNFPRTSSYAFSCFRKIGNTSITIPKEVTSMGNSCFLECGSLQTITFELNSQLSATSLYNFNNCPELLSVILPEGLTTIGKGSFENCIKLYMVDVPSTVTSIESSAFRSIGSYNSYANQTTVIFRGSTPPTCPDTSNKLFGRSTTQILTLAIYVPDGSVDTYKSQTYLSYYSDRIFGISLIPNS